MKLLATVFLIFAGYFDHGSSQNVSSTTGRPASEIVMTMIPSDPHLGNTYMDLNCAFQPLPDSAVHLLISIIVSKAGENKVYSELAAITTGSSKASVRDALGANVTGRIINNGLSYINFKWKFPNAGYIGDFECTAHGIDTFGRPIVVTTTASFTGKTNTLEGVLEQMKQMSLALENTKAQLLQKIDEQRMYLDQQATKIDLQKTQLDNQSEQIKNYSTILGNVTSLLDNARSGIMIASDHYKGHEYLLSRPFYASTSDYRDLTCRLFGGHLVEIDDYDEFNFIRNFLQNKATENDAYISGTDLGHEGRWSHQRTGQDLSFTKWAPRQPGGSKSYNCINVHRAVGWQWGDERCTFEMFFHFLCEVPNK